MEGGRSVRPFRVKKKLTVLTPVITTGIITLGEFASSDDFQKSAGPALREALVEHGWQLIAEAMVVSDRDQIAKTVRGFANQGCHLILTAGGTGISRRDVTPEAIISVARQEIPGFGEEMRRRSMNEAPNAIFSRCLGAIVENSLVIALPGRPEEAVDCLRAVGAMILGMVELLSRESVSKELG